ncbi:ferritin-like domain-containing protein [Undibacterium sp. SXout7W]|uniref:ferritin-like domain-containing protein n=1 Tax=Undibacterium sp. SXout7W TaxID=3413049 RepID=UPI003BF198CE
MHQVKKVHLDTNSIRLAAKNIDNGAVTAGYRANREDVIEMLNKALATELVCMLRYLRHYYTVTGLHNSPVKAEFLQHALDEQDHAYELAERIVQLNGKPDFNPATILMRSHAEYNESTNIHEMVKSNLISERIAIETYRQMIENLADTDPTTKSMLVGIMTTEEEHADDMRDLFF